MGQGIVDLSEARSGYNTSCLSLGQVLLTCLRLGLVVIWFIVLLTCLRLDLAIIEVARVWVRVLLTCLRRDLVVIGAALVWVGYC